jgi:site-specific DNA recombinase
MPTRFYGRVSSEDQSERGTIQNQIEFKNKYCDLHQLGEVPDYLDDGISGTISLEDRPEGKRLLEDAKVGKFDLLLIYKLDRLGRSAHVIINAVYQLEEYGVKVKSMTEVFDTSDPAGRFLLNILASVADLERSNILERMRLGAERTAREGKYLGGIVAYGYRVADGYLSIDDQDCIPGFDITPAELVRRMYSLCANQKYTTLKIAEYFNAVGYPPLYTRQNRRVKKRERKEKTSGLWTPGRIRNMLVNPVYKGCGSYGKRSDKKAREIIEYPVPAIVSAEIWEQARQVLKNNQIEAMKNAKEQYLLRGLIKCGQCGLTYIGTRYNSGKTKKRWYRCNGKHQRFLVVDKICRSKNIDAGWIEEVVWVDCLYFIQRPGEVLKELATNKEQVKKQLPPLRDEIELLNQSIRSKEVEKQKILDLYRHQIINFNDLDAQIKKIADETATLKGRLNDLHNLAETESDSGEYLNSVDEMLRSLQGIVSSELTFEEKRKIVKLLVKEIRVETDEDGRTKLRIKYFFTTGVISTGTDSSPQPA